MSLLAATIQSTGGPAGVGGFTFAATINSTLTSYNVATAATTGGWNGTAVVTATITHAASGEITQTDESSPAFDTGVLPTGSTVALTVESTAFTRGAGGAGGDGGIPALAGNIGIAGGTAVNFQANGSITVDSGGTISGGGGGAGGGGGFLDPAEEDEGYGGGGGGGFPNGAGGTGPLGGADGAAGTTGGGGAGGAGSNTAGTGGTGGAVATAGAAGAASTGAGGSGGAAGSAIEKNGFTVTVTNNGQVDGAVNA